MVVFGSLLNPSDRFRLRASQDKALDDIVFLSSFPLSPAGIKKLQWEEGSRISPLLF